MTTYPYPVEEGRRDIVMSIIFTVITCGIYGLYWQYKQWNVSMLGLEGENTIFGRFSLFRL